MKPEEFDILIEPHETKVMNQVFAAMISDIRRYHIREGKIYGDPRPTSKERYRIVRISGDTIVYKDLLRDRVEYKGVDELLEEWNMLGYKEISNVDSVLDIIKRHLTPLLGGFVVGLLINWILKRVS